MCAQNRTGGSSISGLSLLFLVYRNLCPFLEGSDPFSPLISESCLSCRGGQFCQEVRFDWAFFIQLSSPYGQMLHFLHILGSGIVTSHLPLCLSPVTDQGEFGYHFNQEVLHVVFIQWFLLSYKGHMSCGLMILTSMSSFPCST